MSLTPRGLSDLAKRETQIPHPYELKTVESEWASESPHPEIKVHFFWKQKKKTGPHRLVVNGQFPAR